MSSTTRREDGPSVCSRSLIQFRLKISNYGKHPSAKAANECTRAAASLESDLVKLESGPPAIVAALKQATQQKAQAYTQQAKQLSADIVKVLDAVISYERMTLDEEGWLIVRPLLRLLLWLIPEHVPVCQPQLPQSSSPASRADNGLAAADWRGRCGVSFVQQVVTVTLVTTCFKMLHPRSQGYLDACMPYMQFLDLQPDSKGARTLEESLAWLTLFNRLRVLAADMETACNVPGSRNAPAGVSLGMASPVLAPLRDTLSSMLRTNEVWFIIFAQSVDFWVKGAWFNTMAVGARLNVTQPTVPELINRTASATFADWFKPSPQLANAVGLFDRHPVLIAEWLTAFLTSLNAEDPLLFYPGHSAACRPICIFYTLLLIYFRPWGYSRSPPDPPILVPDHYLEHPGETLEAHLRGLTLSCRITLGSDVPTIHAEWESAVGIVIRAAYVTWQHGPGAQALLGRCQPLRFIPSSITVSPQDTFADLLQCFVGCDWQRQRLTQDSEAEQGGGDDSRSWLKAAVAAAEATHLLLHYAISNKLHHVRHEDASACWQLVMASVQLLQVLHPASPQAFTAQGSERHSKAWALCLANLLKGHTMATEQQGPWGSRNVVAFRVLLDQALPVLQHVGSLAQSKVSDIQPGDGHQAAAEPAVEPAGRPAPQLASHLEGPGFCTAVPEASQQTSSAGEGAVGPQRRCHVPVDSTLLLLQAASNILWESVGLAAGDEDAHRTLSQGLQHAADRTAAQSSSGAPTSEAPAAAEPRSSPAASHHPEHQQGQQASVQLGGTDDLVVALDAVLHLATDLVSGGPWLQQARAQHPLLLIPALADTCSALAHILSIVNRATTGPMLHLQSCVIPDFEPCGVAGAGLQTSSAAGWATQAEAHDCAAGNTAHVVPTGPGVSSLGSSNGSPQQSLVMNSITDLVLQLSVQLVEVVTDPQVVGEARKPAAWMEDVSHFISTTLSDVCSMLGCLDTQVHLCLGSAQRATSAQASEDCSSRACCSAALTTSQMDIAAGSNQTPDHPEGEQSPARSQQPCSSESSTADDEVPAEDLARGRDIRRALQLAAVVPCVPWQRIAAVRACASAWEDENMQYDWDLLRGHVCGTPLLRAVCMLASVGLVTDEQKQGVVALLGGVPICSSGSTKQHVAGIAKEALHTDGTSHSTCKDSSDSTTAAAASSSSTGLLLQEPASLVELRRQHDIRLAQLGVAMLWYDERLVMKSTMSASVSEVAEQLLSTINPAQLPSIAHVSSTLSAAEEDALVPDKEVGLSRGISDLWYTGDLADIYLSWVQETLLKIIDDVLAKNPG